MSGIDNLFQEETLLSNIKIAAYFILLYEHFEDVVISTVKEFYAHDCVLNGQLFLSIDDAYIQCLEKNRKWGETVYSFKTLSCICKARKENL